MRINKQKRIGEIVIITEGKNPEFQIVEDIFNKFLGYSIAKKAREELEYKELIGHDNYSKVILINSPTSNIASIEDPEDFYDFLFREVSLKFNKDLINDAVYILFDRDPKNNKQGKVGKLLKVLNSSQNDSYEQNGLLLLNYPSVESFVLSLYEDNSYEKEYALGKDLKDYLTEQNYNQDIIYDDLITHATQEFIDGLIWLGVIKQREEVFVNSETIGYDLFLKETRRYQQKNVFYCVSQLIQILIDLHIIEF